MLRPPGKIEIIFLLRPRCCCSSCCESISSTLQAPPPKLVRLKLRPTREEAGEREPVEICKPFTKRASNLALEIISFRASSCSFLFVLGVFRLCRRFPTFLASQLLTRLPRTLLTGAGEEVPEDAGELAIVEVVLVIRLRVEDGQ